MAANKQEFSPSTAVSQEPAEARERAEEIFCESFRDFLSREFSGAPALISWLQAPARRPTLRGIGSRDEGRTWEFQVVVDTSAEGFWMCALRAAELKNAVTEALEERERWGNKHSPRALADVLKIDLGPDVSAESAMARFSEAAKTAEDSAKALREEADELYARHQDVEEMKGVQQKATREDARARDARKFTEELRVEWPRQEERLKKLQSARQALMPLRDDVNDDACRSWVDACRPGSEIYADLLKTLNASAEQSFGVMDRRFLDFVQRRVRASCVTSSVVKTAVAPAREPSAPVSLRNRVALGVLLTLGLVGGGVALSLRPGVERSPASMAELDASAKTVADLLSQLDTQAWLDGLSAEKAREFVLKELNLRFCECLGAPPVRRQTGFPLVAGFLERGQFCVPRASRKQGHPRRRLPRSPRKGAA